jgi:acyl-[acyl-carrier-protein]-phospholipid O-acyltransferase/long-chain-fatty-acid--[acyl-carrier-protein] ligase
MSQTVAEPAATSRDFEPDTPLSPLPASWTSLGRAFVEAARARRAKLAIADTMGAELSYGEVLLRSVALGRALARNLGPAPYVGVFLPPSAPCAIANVALTLIGKIPVNLNYTTGQAVVDSSVAQCGITHVLTSRRAIDKFGLEPGGTPVYLEDVPRQLSKLDKAWAAMVARVVPLGMLGAFLPGLRHERLDATATVIFTSGSTGEPKGVVLSHGNVLSNVHQIESQLKLQEDEVVLGVLPLFHSFGYTVTLWTVLCLGKTAIYHFNPTDAKIVGTLCHRYKVTMLAASPTFMGFYLRKGTPEQFRTVRLPVLGSEKLQPEVAEHIRAKLGIEPLEGYGCTETGPVVSVNVPDPKRTRDGRVVPGNRPGTVGMPVPGTAIKTTDVETGADLPRGAEGVIHVKGPQVMQGYLNRPELTARVLQDGWYATGDVGRVDEDGFLSITGRLSRFSKVGGEMVPHQGVESAILSALDEADPHLVVTGVRDPKRGERLVVLYTEMSLDPQELHRRLVASPLPRLWIPSPEDFLHVPEIPIRGTKVDLQAVNRIAAESRGPGADEA